MTGEILCYQAVYLLCEIAREWQVTVLLSLSFLNDLATRVTTRFQHLVILPLFGQLVSPSIFQRFLGETWSATRLSI